MHSRSPQEVSKSQILVVVLKRTISDPADNFLFSPRFDIKILGEEMYFIIRGCCDVLNAEWDTVRTLNENEYFGEIALLAQTPRLCSVRASSYCLLAEITREKFLPILDQFPEQREAIIENMTRYINSFMHADDDTEGEEEDDDEFAVGSARGSRQFWEFADGGTADNVPAEMATMFAPQKVRLALLINESGLSRGFHLPSIQGPSAAFTFF